MNKNIHDNHRKEMFGKMYHNYEWRREWLDDYDLLEVVLFLTNKMKDTHPIARRLITHFRNYKNIIDADFKELLKIDGVGIKTVTMIKLLKEIYKRTQRQETYIKKLNTNDLLVQYGIDFFKSDSRERLYAICLDKHYHTICNVKLSKNEDITSILRKLALCRTKIVAFMINQSSDSIALSLQDAIQIESVKQRLSSIGIVFLDYIIVSKNYYYSYVDQKTNALQVTNNKSHYQKMLMDNTLHYSTK